MPVVTDLRVSDSPARQGQRTCLSLLWLAWAGSLIGAMLLGNLAGGHGAPVAVAARMGSSVVLVVVAWLEFAWWKSAPASRFALAVAIGMTLGAVGDFFNAELLNFVPLKDPVLGGIVAFALGHVAYTAGCLDLARRTGAMNPGTMLPVLIAWQIVGLVGWCFVVIRGTEARGLVWPALPYSLLLAGTAGVTSGLGLQDRRFRGLAVGGALFLVSDLILAFGLFRGRFEHQTECVWLTYGPGQMLIVLSAAVAVRALARPMADA